MLFAGSEIERTGYCGCWEWKEKVISCGGLVKEMALVL